MARQVEAVRAAVADLEQLPVIPALCFVDAEWGLFTKPFRLHGVLVTWPKALAKEIEAAAPAISGIDAQTLAGRVAAALPVA